MVYVPSGSIAYAPVANRPAGWTEIEIVWLDRQLSVRSASPGAARFFEWPLEGAKRSAGLRTIFEDPALEVDLRAVLKAERTRAKVFVEYQGQRLGRVVVPHGCEGDIEGVAVIVSYAGEIGDDGADAPSERGVGAERSILNATSDAVLTVTAEGTIEDFNLAAEALFGPSLAEMRGMAIGSLLPDLEALMPVQALLERSRRYRGIESQIVDHDGRETPIHLVVSELEWSNSFILSLRDFTAIRIAQQRALQRGRLAAVGETMTALAHESRNALQRMQSCLTLLELRAVPEMQDLIEDMQDAQDQLQRLYEEVRHFAAPLHLRLGETDLGALLRRVWRDLKVEWSPKRLVWQLEDKTHGLRARLDSERISQVLRNVIENAIHVSPAGGVIEAQIQSATLHDKRAAQIEIMDQGPGISPDDAARAFDLLFTTKEGGTGMGLAIARRIVQDHGGVIDIGPARRGTRVTITLPWDGESAGEGMA